MRDERLFTRWLVVTVAGLFVLATAYTGWGISQVPAGALVPTHFDISGTPDAFGSRWTLLLGPGVHAFVVLLVALIPRIEPRRTHMRMSFGALRVLLVLLSFFFAGLSVILVETALGSSIDVSRLLLVAMGLLFLVLGNMLGKIRSNFTFGVRTPWTLTSERSWLATHRLVGWLWVITGLVGVGLGVAGITEAGILVLLGLILGSVVVAFVYSWWVWRNDPDRIES